ncbi:MAG: peptidylprolyl isomerase, partial [Pseudomonadota bacterium]
PLEFALGSGQVIAGFDKAVSGMAVCDTKTVTLPPEDAYGAHNPDHAQPFPRDKFPPGMTIELGSRLELQSPDGKPMAVTVAEITDDHIVLDGNHPLAGKALTFELELVEIVGA